MRICTLLAVVAFLSFFSPQKALSREFGEPPEETTSPLTYGITGFGVGTLVGASVGYLVVRDSSFSDNWRTFVLSIGIGALVGAGVGVMTGIIEMGLEEPGFGSIVLRDILWGTLFGGVIGLAAGGLSGLMNGEWEHLLLGTCIGALAGAGAGIVLGIIEASISDRRRKKRKSNVKVDVTITEDAQSRILLLPGVSGTF